MLRYLGIPSRVAVGFTSGQLPSTASGSSPTATRTCGSRSGSTAGAGCRSTRRRGAAGSRGRTRPRRRASTSPRRPPCSPARRGCTKFGNTLANTLGFGTTAAHLAGRAPARHGAGRGGADDASPARLGDPAAAAPRDSRRRSCCSRWRSCCVRGSRFLTRDPRRLAGACRKELRDFLLDQGVDVPASATLRELAALVESSSASRRGRSGCTRPPPGSRLASGRARGGPGHAARPAAVRSRDPAGSSAAPSASAACSRCGRWALA